MKISEVFKKEKKTFSFEFFPSKDYTSTMSLGVAVGRLIKLDPSFISVTYGAGGTTQNMSFDLLNYLQNKVGFVSMAHYTCVNASKEKVESDLNYLYEHNIINLMLLRGDPPKGQERFIYDNESGFNHASDLVEFAVKGDRFSIGVAGYPEKHPEAKDMDEDIMYLKNKVSKGADFIATQMFFKNNYYFDFVEKAKSVGVNKRVIPGIMPITNYKQIKRFAEISGSHIPEEISEKFLPYVDDPKKSYQIGIDLAIKQCIDLLEGGAPGLHFYTLNKSNSTIDIYESLPYDLISRN